MTLHLIKLAVGCDSVADLAAWQTQRLADMKRSGQKPELVHVTRQTPKRAGEVLDGGSLFWVIKGWILARQKLIELRPLTRSDIPHCGLVYQKKLVTVEPRPCRAFQGWRYLEGEDAPPDMVRRDKGGEMPETMMRELRALGLI